MPERKDDEIMAEYLLKGGKMLEKACPACGCPMFEYKKKTFCVVCAEKEAAAKSAKNTNAPAAPAAASDPFPRTRRRAAPAAGITMLSPAHVKMGTGACLPKKLR